jgi:hypothetical protein
MNQPDDGWPELTYAYVKHYFWEPQHLTHTEASLVRAMKHHKKRIDAVDELLRTEEVPLNYLLNVLLRIAPASLRRTCLKPFGIDLMDPGLATLDLRTPEDVASIQPDVQLESDKSRVFIELKVESKLTLEQIRKYVRRHQGLNTHPRPAKKPYVLLLVKDDQLRLYDDKSVRQDFSFDALGEVIPQLHEPYAGEVTFGVTTWLALGEALYADLRRRREEQTDSLEMLEVLVGDFLKDLKSRHPWPKIAASPQWISGGAPAPLQQP